MLKFKLKRIAAGLVFLFFFSEIINADDLPQSTTHDYLRSEASYNIPSLLMLDRKGREIDLLQTINYGGPVLIQFIFATCSSICPVLSASFSVAQPALDNLNGGVYRLISISIDPEQDRPEKLDEYAKRFKAGEKWYFLTGNRTEVDSILKSFNAAYSGNNKMFHKPLTFMRSGVGNRWVRIEGLLGKGDLISEYKNMMDLID